MSDTILITGCRRGIGHDAAIALAKRGHTVFAAVHFEKDILPNQQATDRDGLRITWLKLDVTDPKDVARAAQLEPDVLINNAAVGQTGPLAEIPLERVRLGFETNVIGALALIQAVVPGMAARGHGRIVNISSVAGRFVIPALGPYVMTKFSLEAMSDVLRVELAPLGIKVAIIEPGKILTGFNEQMLATKWEWLKADSLFKDKFDLWRKRDKNFTPGSNPTTSVVDAIVAAVESPKPRIRTVAPSNNRVLVRLARSVSDRISDWFFR
ncbi:MAG TPA: SDR family NAD(P)-dependent oxidoreductase [Verrucomicrobiae bacterium]|nr:SDR family NAD(P)-dependent oxidoreductase [Verrucomicrobiae bacterium]